MQKRPARVACLLLACLTAGCGGPATPAADRPGKKALAAVSQTSPAKRQAPAPAKRLDTKRPAPRVSDNTAGTTTTEAAASPDAAAAPPADRAPGRNRSLADLLSQPADATPRWVENLPRIKVDDARAAAAGIRKLPGRRLTLYTDLPESDELRQLPGLFDLAFPQWCEYFGIDPAKHADWQMTGFLIKDKARFEQTGLLPKGLPPFQNGFSRNYELWLYDQPSDYYRRHLLLHEGTHGLMNTTLGGCGPPWYMEGVAELLATHRWQDGRLTLGYMPQSREEVPEWGRIRIIKDAVAAGRTMRLRDVIGYSTSAHLEVEPYAWCWAAATLLDKHPRYHERFRGLLHFVTNRDLSQQFYGLIGDQWQELSEEWQLLVAGLEYGYDVPRTAVDFTPGKPLPPSGATVTVVADRGWQNSGLRLDAAATYRLRAAGRYQVARQPQIWWCEPGGVSIRYYQGRPLGILLGAIRPDRPEQESESALLQPFVVGLDATLVPQQTGTLFLKINDSAAELGENEGELEMQVVRLGDNSDDRP